MENKSEGTKAMSELRRLEARALELDFSRINGGIVAEALESIRRMIQKGDCYEDPREVLDIEGELMGLNDFIDRFGKLPRGY